MILCISPNPALDHSVVVDTLNPGQVHRVTSALMAAGGKGINVVRAIRNLGGQGVGMGFLGGATGKRIAELCDQEQLAGAWTWIETETRTCVIIVDLEQGHATVINERGAHATAADWQRLTQEVQRESLKANAVCFSGSLPPGIAPQQYAELITSVNQPSRTIWVDTSGDSLRAAMQVPGIIIKVNGDEAGAILEMSVESVDSARHATSMLRAFGPAAVVITLGAKGAIFSHSTGTWYAQPPVIQAVDAVGSGDSFLAGIVYAIDKGLDPGTALKYGVAAGAANATTVGGGDFPHDTFQDILNRTQLELL
jgi:1-phosphofructokinase family hexose kinase